MKSISPLPETYRNKFDLGSVLRGPQFTMPNANAWPGMRPQIKAAGCPAVSPQVLRRCGENRNNPNLTGFPVSHPSLHHTPTTNACRKNKQEKNGKKNKTLKQKQKKNRKKSHLVCHKASQLPHLIKNSPLFNLQGMSHLDRKVTAKSANSKINSCKLLGMTQPVKGYFKKMSKQKNYKKLMD